MNVRRVVKPSLNDFKRSKVRIMFLQNDSSSHFYVIKSQLKFFMSHGTKKDFYYPGMIFMSLGHKKLELTFYDVKMT